MNYPKLLFNRLFLLIVVILTGCENHLIDMNNNPGGIDQAEVNPNFVVTTVLTEAAKKVVDNGYGDIAGIMQHTQKAVWSSSHNKYGWMPNDWNDYYLILMNNDIACRRAVELDCEYLQGVCFVMKSYLFGMVTDFWGDAPYTDALKGEENKEEYEFPAFDSQEVIYKGILEDLNRADSLLSKNRADYKGIDGDADIFFNGDPGKWRKFANSLALRYYMRLSEKLPSFAEAGVKKMLQRPLIGSVEEEVAMDYINNGNWEDSWPNNILYDNTQSNFIRLKACATLVNRLLELNDPRIHIWFSPVEIPIKVVTSEDIPGNAVDTVMDGVRYLTLDYLIKYNMKIFNPDTYKQDCLDGYTMVDTNSVYVGMPASGSRIDGSLYNLNPHPGSVGFNPHVSLLGDIFKEPEGELLKARVLSYAEVCFLKAEAALRGWGGDAEKNYYAGIKASLDAWGIGGEYDTYIKNEGVVFDGTLAQIMEQKWIASFTAASEAWFDWRRTGLPDLKTGPFPKRDRMPLRFYYGANEKELNSKNYKAALSNFEETDFSSYDGPDSAWSKMWLLQGTGKPW